MLEIPEEHLPKITALIESLKTEVMPANALEIVAEAVRDCLIWIRDRETFDKRVP